MSTKSRTLNKSEHKGLPDATKAVVQSSPKLLPSPISASRRRKKLGQSAFWPRSSNHNVMPPAPSLAPLEDASSQKSLKPLRNAGRKSSSSVIKSAASVTPENHLPSNETPRSRERTSSDTTTSTQNDSSSSSRCSQERATSAIKPDDTVTMQVHEPLPLQKTASSPAPIAKEFSRKGLRRDAPSSLRRPSMADNERVQPNKRLVRRNSAGKLRPKEESAGQDVEKRVPLARRLVRSLSAGKLMQRQAPPTDISAARETVRSLSAGKLAQRGKSEAQENENVNVSSRKDPVTVSEIRPRSHEPSRRRHSKTRRPSKAIVDLTLDIRSSNSIDAPTFEPSLVHAKESENLLRYTPANPAMERRKRNPKRKTNKSPVVDISLLYNKRDDSPPRSQLGAERKPPERTLSTDETILSEVERLCCNLSTSSAQGQTFSLNGKLILETDDNNLTDDESLVSDDDDSVDTDSKSSENENSSDEKNMLPRSPSPAPPEIQQERVRQSEQDVDLRNSEMAGIDKLHRQGPDDKESRDEGATIAAETQDISRRVKFVEDEKLATVHEYHSEDVEDFITEDQAEPTAREVFAPRFIIDQLKSVRKAELNLALVRICHSFEKPIDRNAIGGYLDDLKTLYEVQVPKKGQRRKKGVELEVEEEFLRGLECFLCDSYGFFQRQHRSSVLLAQKRQWRKLSKKAAEGGLEKSNELPDLRKASLKTSRPLRHTAIQMARYDAKQSLSAVLTKWECDES